MEMLEVLIPQPLMVNKFEQNRRPGRKVQRGPIFFPAMLVFCLQGSLVCERAFKKMGFPHQQPELIQSIPPYLWTLPSLG